MNHPHVLFPALVALALACGGIPVPTPGPEPASAPAGTSITLSLHGNTPTLAWKPDGSALLAGTSFQAETYTEHPSAEEGALRIRVPSGASERVVKTPAYHPTWLAGDAFAWTASVWEIGSWEMAGLFWEDASGRHQAPGIEGDERGGFGSLRPHEGGQLLVWADYEHDAPGWYVFAPETQAYTRWKGEVHPSEGDASGAWFPPEDPQCPSSVGGVSVRVDGARFAVLSEGSEGEPVVEGELYRYEYANGGSSCDAAPMCGPVAPCLSPDGTHVAWAAPGGEGTWTLEIRGISGAARARP